MISDEAGRALGLISAIELCKQDDAALWRSAVTRIVLDLDEVAAEREVIRIREMLAGVWRKLPDKPQAATAQAADVPVMVKVYIANHGKRESSWGLERVSPADVEVEVDAATVERWRQLENAYWDHREAVYWRAVAEEEREDEAQAGRG